MCSLENKSAIPSRKIQFEPFRGSQIPPYQAKSGGKMLNFMVFLQRMLIILPKCQYNDNYVFLGSQDFYAISNSQFAIFRVFKIPPMKQNLGVKSLISWVFFKESSYFFWNVRTIMKMYSLGHKTSMSSRKSHFGVFRVFEIPPIKQNLGVKCLFLWVFFKETS